MRALPAIIILCLCATPAFAGPDNAERFQIIEGAEQVEVVARGATAAAGARIGVVRERLEIPLVGSVRSARRSSDDTTVRRVEIRGDAPRVLSIKLRADRDRMAGIAERVRFVQIGDALHVTIPRAVVVAPPPGADTFTEGIVDEKIELEPPAAANATGSPSPAPLATRTTPTTTTPTTTAPTPTAATTTTPMEAASMPGQGRTAAAAPTDSSPSIGVAGGAGPVSTRWWMVVGGIALIGGGVFAAVRRRRRVDDPVDQLEVIASRSLGGKARVVWLGAGDREIVIAISPQQIRPLGQWRRGARGVERDFGRVLDGVGAADAGPAPSRDAPGPRRLARASASASPAVSGLIRLRERTPPVNEDVATGDEDADAEWAKDLLAATGGRR